MHPYRWGSVGLHVDSDTLLYYNPAVRQLRQTYSVQLWQMGANGTWSPYLPTNATQAEDQPTDAICDALTIANQEVRSKTKLRHAMCSFIPGGQHP